MKGTKSKLIYGTTLVRPMLYYRNAEGLVIFVIGLN